MKKVGIITYHHYYNYGTVLQAYALNQAINRIEGFQAEIIDFRFAEEKELSKWKLFFLRLRRLPIYLFEWKRVMRIKQHESVIAAKYPKFDAFFSHELIQSKQTFHSLAEIKRADLDYDVLVTGSDQTWSPKIGFHPALFLEFGSPKALRIAYAPSIGVSKLSKEEADFLNAHLQHYDAISCRESIGTEILKSTIKGKTICNVLDPTFLLTRDEWNEIAVGPEIKGDYILCYFIGHKTYYRDIARQLSRDLNLPLYYIPVSWRDLGNDCNVVPEAGPKEFLGLIRDARLVLTDSFHGTILSINYRKSFYSFTKIEGGKSASDNSRLYDILSKFHLEDRLNDSPGIIHFSDVDYSIVERVLEQERQHSLSFLLDSLTDHRICAHFECTGCLACEAVCSHRAIIIQKDLMGFYYPQKDTHKCTNCGLCSINCPNNMPPHFSAVRSSFVATAQDKIERQTSTSGGIASVMARQIISSGGIVYGCTSQDASHVRHIRIDKEEDIVLLKGSKYVQSDLKGVLSSVKKDLHDGHIVLFIGTPCQVAGLKSLLHRPYNNLFTVDFVCHGVPSQQILSNIIYHDYAFLSGKRIDFRFKDMDGLSHYGIKIENVYGQCEFKETYPQSRFITGFLGGMFYRESCYQCHYARGERVSDISLGDYWDKEHSYSTMGKEGLSMMMVNTSQGENLVARIEYSILKQAIPYTALQSRTAQLCHPMPKHRDYEAFRFEFMNKGYSEGAKYLLDKEYQRVKREMRKNSIIIIIKDLVSRIR